MKQMVRILGVVLILFLIISICQSNGRPTPSPQYAPSQTTIKKQIIIPTITSTIIPTITPIPTREPVLTLPPQGLYDSCVPYYTDCLEHLNILAAKGFKLILNYGQLYGNTKSLIDYANRAQSLGMQVIWPILPRLDGTNNSLVVDYSDLASEAGCADNDCFINYFVSLVKNHPATWGYYIADEVDPSKYTQIKRWTDVIKSADPNHPRMFVISGSNDPMEQYFRFYSYMRDTAEVFGPDYYPYGYIDTGTNLTRFTGKAANHAQYWANKLEKQTVMVLQAFDQRRYTQAHLCEPWPTCSQFPTFEQMKAQRDQTLLNSQPVMILWWTYQDIIQTDDPEKSLNDLTAAAFAPLPAPIPSPTLPANICPASWHCEDIGHPTFQGTQSIAENFWTIQGSGWDISLVPYIKADQFRFIWQNMTNDGEFSARIISQSNTNPLAKAGIMVRKTFDPVSPYYAVYATSDGVYVQFRPDFGQPTQELGSISTKLPIYLKIAKSGIDYTVYTSTDGIKWSPILGAAKKIASLDNFLMAGIAVTSGDENIPNIVTTEGIRFQPTSP